ncbi:MAG: FAD binding domain-containing protein [Alphaproteobacteria bacterium]
MNKPQPSSTTRRPRVVVVGGSLGGLLAGNMLHRIGCDVTVHERVGVELSERGAGIATHPELHRAFESLGIPTDASFGVPIEERLVLGRDGTVLARYHMAQLQATWGSLYRSLKRVFPVPRYHAGSTFVRAEQSAAGVRAIFSDGSTIEADLLIGADGIRSTVRSQFWPEAVPRYAGYVAWRGTVEEARFSPETHAVLFTRFVVCLPPGEHMVGYPVAGQDGDTTPGKRRFNFVWYRAASETKLRRMMTDAAGRYYEGGIPPDRIDPAVVAEMKSAAAGSLAPPYAEVIRLVREPFFQTIVDLEMPSMVQGRVALLGDGAFVARPHPGMGVIKAVGDAVTLAEAIQANPGHLDRALALYDAERCAYGRYLVERARRLGTQIDTGLRTPEQEEAGAYYRQPENVIRAISMPPASSPLERYTAP